MQRWHYSDTIADFINLNDDEILGKLVSNFSFDIGQPLTYSWKEEIKIMKKTLAAYSGRGKIYFEYDIPRLGRRIDVLILIDHVIFVVEFKVGADSYDKHSIDQVCDYALDLKNFHKTSHAPLIAPILVATNAPSKMLCVEKTPQNDNLLIPICANATTLINAIGKVLEFEKEDIIAPQEWEEGSYSPTPTIIEAATALYRGHSVSEISRSDAGAYNLSSTLLTINEIIADSKENSRKAICFVTGVPGAGKTLVGLNVAAENNDVSNDLHSVFLSGNGPLVDILREALARDKVRHEKEQGDSKFTKKKASQEVKTFIQNVHHFRDDCLRDTSPPHEHIVLFDEAQRAWDEKQTTAFMLRKKGRPNFNQSEPEFLISCLDRHEDWAVIVCLVGGGQEINTGEAGISGWIDALAKKFTKWNVYISSCLTDKEYAADKALSILEENKQVYKHEKLHLSTSMRSFRSEKVSLFVKQLLDMETEKAHQTLKENIKEKYPIMLTRDLDTAKTWLHQKARGSERYGIVASSYAERLRPHAIHVKAPMKPTHWFLDDKDDIRSSYYLEDVATEFAVQGLEIDWACLTWDADFRYAKDGWENWFFRGSRWMRVHKDDRKLYQKNAYRVLLTRARQGMIIVVPEGDASDPTRDKSYYNSTFDYLKNVGLNVI